MKNPLSLEAFADWLEGKPAEQKYEYWCQECAIGGYFIELGLPMKSLGTEKWRDRDGVLHVLPPGFDEVSSTPPHTYGAAARRARDLVTQGE